MVCMDWIVLYGQNMNDESWIMNHENDIDIDIDTDDLDFDFDLDTDLVGCVWWGKCVRGKV